MFLITLYLCSLVGCQSTKPLYDPSTIITVDIPPKIMRDETLLCKVGIGVSPSVKYEKEYQNKSETGYIETILTISGKDITFNDSKETYTQTYDFTEKQYVCTPNDEPTYFFDLTIDFSKVQDFEGTIRLELVSYFKDGSFIADMEKIYYKIKNDKIYFSLYTEEFAAKAKMTNIFRTFILFLPVIVGVVIVCFVVVIKHKKHQKQNQKKGELS